LWLKIIPKEIIGEIFETSIFSELVKKFGKNSIYYWRTKDKKEIDFILRDKNKIIPIEVKTNFASFSKRTIEYFLQKYKTSPKQYYCIGLHGKKKEKEFISPWEI
jgi:predicted AAA+ superfamily ATPase